jgi:hypothetical protein
MEHVHSPQAGLAISFAHQVGGRLLLFVRCEKVLQPHVV